MLITPVKSNAEILATSDDLSAKPGHISEGDFLVTNFGFKSDFSITGTDSGRFSQYMEPTVYVINPDFYVILFFIYLL